METVLSIGIPVYNVKEEYFKACLERVLNIQSAQIEVLVIDDCSTDKRVDTCRQYAMGDGRVKWVRLEKNEGVSAVRNRMIAMAKGKWMFFLDADDLLCDGFVDSILQADLPEADMIYYDYRLIEAAKEPNVQSIPAPYIAAGEHQVKRLCVCHLCALPSRTEQMNLSATATMKLFRRQFLLEHQLRFIEKLEMAEDRLFLVDVLSCRPRVFFSTQIAYLYRVYPGSVSRRYNDRIPDMTDRYLAYGEERIQRIFGGEKTVQTLYLENHVTTAILNNMELDIFHRDNPNSRSERKRRFAALLEKEPYQSAIEAAVIKNCILREKRILLHYVRKRSFFMVQLLCRHRFLLRLYSTCWNRWEKQIARIRGVFEK